MYTIFIFGYFLSFKKISIVTFLNVTRYTYYVDKLHVKLKTSLVLMLSNIVYKCPVWKYPKLSIFRYPIQQVVLIWINMQFCNKKSIKTYCTIRVSSMTFSVKKSMQIFNKSDLHTCKVIINSLIGISLINKMLLKAWLK